MAPAYWLLSKIYKKALWKKQSSTAVYLTFDDGPHPEITPWVLQILKKYNAKATFFVVGENAQKYPEVIGQILAEGHQLGNHTYNHLKGWQTPNTTYLDNVKRCDSVIKTPLFRPPYGRINWQVYKELSAKRRVVMWSLLSKDYLPGLNRKRALARLKKHTQKGDIVVFHDSQKAENNLKELLPKYLQFLVEKGVKINEQL